MEFVEQKLEKKGYEVEDCHFENRGYDLLASRSGEILEVEGKGTSATEARFFITRNERRASKTTRWRLAIVTSSRTKPSMQLLTAQEAEKRFVFEPLAWECKRRG